MPLMPLIQDYVLKPASGRDNAKPAIYAREMHESHMKKTPITKAGANTSSANQSAFNSLWFIDARLAPPEHPPPDTVGNINVGPA